MDAVGDQVPIPESIAVAENSDRIRFHPTCEPQAFPVRASAEAHCVYIRRYRSTRLGPAAQSRLS